MTHSIWKTSLKAIVTLALGVSLIACSSDDSGKKGWIPDKTEKPEPEPNKPAKKSPYTISDMISAEVGARFENVDCLEVIATNTQGILLEENGSRIYAFKGGEHDLVPGDYVTVSGTIAERNGLKQLDKVDLIIAKTSHNDAFKQPDATTVSVKDIEAYMKAPEVKYATFEGVIIVAGNYVNVQIEGTSVIGSLDYMTDDFKTKYNNHKVTITGYLFGSYKNFMYCVPTEVTDNGNFEEKVPEGAIFYSSFDKEVAVQDKDKYQTSKGWPWLDQFDGWQNQKGSGVSNVTYSYAEASVRTNQSSKGDLSSYDGSGNNNIFFGGSTEQAAYFTIEKIDVPSENLRLSFGAQRYAQGAANDFLKSDFQVTMSADGKVWSPAIEYDFGGVEDKKDGTWRLATADFTLPAGTKTLYIKFTAKAASVNRLDDVLLVAGKGGQKVEFGKEVVIPVSKIADVVKGETDKIYKVEGVIIATHTKGFLVKDDSGIILTFKKKHGRSVGEKVTVEGTTTVYGGFTQFGETSTITVNGTETVTNPTPEEFKAAQFEAYVKSPSIKYVTYTGTLNAWRDQIYQWHTDLDIEGTSIKANVSYADNTKYPELNDSNNGTKYVITGYVLGVTGTDTKVVNTMMTSIKKAE